MAKKPDFLIKINILFNWHDVCLGSVTDRMCTRPAEPKRDHPVQAQKKEDISMNKQQGFTLIELMIVVAI
ncbi:MAG: prepilin-type N-terminal cleavage/methylation domain-containing protein, partial [Pseudomonadota bacterium]|nr:prepilin-type N-terminal cleavage/methylation domain-containing protein [Pseudomonadota bacterium]